MAIPLRIRPGLVGIILLALLGIGAWAAWGRPSGRRTTMPLEPLVPASIPPIDAQMPTGLATATFSLG